MALDYQLNLEADFSAEELFEFLIRECNFERASEEVIKNQGMIAGRVKETDNCLFQKAYGFAPSTYIWFRLGKSGDHIAQHQTTVYAVVTLLETISGKAVLLFNSEITVLWRLDERILIDEEWQSGSN